MSKKDVLELFYTNSANLNIKSILLTLAAGLLIGGIIFVTYYITYKGVAYNAKFNLSLVVILLISIVIMLMISSNIVISLGMVGALSIVRFRTAIKDSRDTVFIFWAIAEGLSVGSRNFKLLLITTLFVAVVLVATAFLPKFREKYLLVINAQKDVDITELEKEIDANSLYFKLRSSVSTHDRKEFIYEVVMGKENSANDFNKISDIPCIDTVNLVLQSGDNIG